MHKANHPRTKHYCENILEVDPREACGGRRIGFVWFSPDCTHFSKAKGTMPRSKETRGLAWVVIRWAREVRPRVIFLENVEEFETWGPLDDDGQPIKAKAGETFREWIAELRALGYQVEWRSLTAADYGTPTTRRRLFLIARCDGQPIAWPDPTHGKGRSASWRPAAEIIDWSLSAPSIFGRKRPLAEATLKRIAAGVRRYVVEAAQPFVLPVTHQGDARVHSVDEPVRTITAAHRGELALATPYIVRHGHYSTITGAGLREGCGAGTFRGQSARDPLGTVCATNDKHVVCPIVTKHYGGMVGHRADRTLGTVTAKDHHALSAARLAPAGLRRNTEVRSFLARFAPAAATAPQRALFNEDPTILRLHGEPYQIVDIGMRMLQPHELFAAQGFPETYSIAPEFNGKPLTKTDQTMLAGNSVCPQVAEALVRANMRSGRRAAS
jgi:DNA (cytosine-5)-methyltransferase 1